MTEPATAFPVWAWFVFGAGLLACLALDLILHRGGRLRSHAAAITWTGLWIGVGLGFAFVVWGVLLRIVLVMHSTFFVNSATHLWGSRRYETRDDSRNLWWVGLIALGEGWHNNHHGRPSAANNGFHAWYELDPSFLLIVGLAAVGLVSEVKVFRPSLGRTEIWFRPGAQPGRLQTNASSN